MFDDKLIQRQDSYNSEAERVSDKLNKDKNYAFNNGKIHNLISQVDIGKVDVGELTKDKKKAFEWIMKDVV